MPPLHSCEQHEACRGPCVCCRGSRGTSGVRVAKRNGQVTNRGPAEPASARDRVAVTAVDEQSGPYVRNRCSLALFDHFADSLNEVARAGDREPGLKATTHSSPQAPNTFARRSTSPGSAPCSASLYARVPDPASVPDPVSVACTKWPGAARRGVPRTSVFSGTGGTTVDMRWALFVGRRTGPDRVWHLSRCLRRRRMLDVPATAGRRLQ